MNKKEKKECFRCGKLRVLYPIKMTITHNTMGGCCKKCLKELEELNGFDWERKTYPHRGRGN